MTFFESFRHGGGIIKRKSLLAVILLFSIATFINLSAVSAANSTYDTNSVVKSGTTVKNYVETKHTVPTTVTVNKKQVSKAQYLYLETKTVGNLYKGVKTPVTVKSIYNPTAPKESVKSGSLTKSQYVTLANKISSYQNAYGKTPNYVSTPLGNMRYENLIYTYAKVLNFYQTNHRLPNYVTVKPWKSVTATKTTSSASEGTQTVTQILRTAAKYKYSHLASDAAGLMRYGSGDCWAMSDYLYKKISAAGYSVRIIQYNSGYTSNHRSVQTMNSARKWVDVNYTGNGINIMFNAWPTYNPKPGQISIKTFYGSYS